MMERIEKPEHCFGYYVWQTESYGQSHYYANTPCEIFSGRLTPSTPSGDFVAEVPTARQGLELCAQIQGMDLEAAKRHVESVLSNAK